MHKAAQGGRLGVIKYLAPLFGARVHNKTNTSYTMLHWAAQNGHCQVARYLIESLKMNPQDRDKVCGEGGEGGVPNLSAKATLFYKWKWVSCPATLSVLSL